MNTSIVSLGELSKPATVLIEKISDALGGYFKPYQIKRVARAKAEAEIIEARGKIKITALQKRALKRFLAEEAKKQDNIEKITQKAIPQLDESSRPEQIEDDWITNFFDKCRIVSDDEMQTLWSRILAGEANNPGSFSKRTVNYLSSLDKYDALLFKSLCGFCWRDEEMYFFPLIYDSNEDIYNKEDINFSTLEHLADIGLINFDFHGNFVLSKLDKRVKIMYYDKPIIIEFKSEKDNAFKFGKIIFTKAGQQLARICGSKSVDGFMDYALNYWIKEGLIVSSPICSHKK